MECIQISGNQKSQLTLIDIVEKQAEQHGERCLYSFLNRNLDVVESMSFRGLLDRAKTLSAHLQKSFRVGETLLLCYPFGLDFIVSFWAAILTGCTPIPCNRPRGNNWTKIYDIAAVTHARGLLSNSQIGGRLAQSCGLPQHCQLVLTDNLLAGATHWTRPCVSASDPAFIQFTSGSTSSPKGVCVTHHNALSNLEAIQKGFLCREQDITVSWLPFYHDMGLVGHVLEPLYSGMHNYFLSPMDFLACPSRWLEAMSKFKATVSGAPNFAYKMCCNKVTDQQVKALDLNSWRLAYCGSEPVSAKVAKQFFQKFSAAGFSENAFQPCYGMAESTLYICSKSGLLECKPNGSDARYVCLGLPEGADVRIVDNDTNTECDEGDIGEVWLRSASVARQYIADDARTRSLMNADLGTDAGFLRTGDLAFKRKGELYLVGREKNVIKSRGRSVYGEDIERSVSRDLASDQFERCAIVEVFAEEVSLLYLLLERCRKSHALFHKDVLEERLKAKVLKEFGLILARVLFLNKGSIPLTSSGKLKRGECGERIKTGQWLEAEING